MRALAELDARFDSVLGPRRSTFQRLTGADKLYERIHARLAAADAAPERALALRRALADLQSDPQPTPAPVITALIHTEGGVARDRHTVEDALAYVGVTVEHLIDLAAGKTISIDQESTWVDRIIDLRTDAPDEVLHQLVAHELLLR